MPVERTLLFDVGIYELGGVPVEATSFTQALVLTGIASAEACGTPTLTLFVTVQGIASAEAFGLPRVVFFVAEAPQGLGHLVLLTTSARVVVRFDLGRIVTLTPAANTVVQYAKGHVRILTPSGQGTPQ